MLCLYKTTTCSPNHVDASTCVRCGEPPPTRPSGTSPGAPSSALSPSVLSRNCHRLACLLIELPGACRTRGRLSTPKVEARHVRLRTHYADPRRAPPPRRGPSAVAALPGLHWPPRRTRQVRGRSPHMDGYCPWPMPIPFCPCIPPFCIGVDIIEPFCTGATPYEYLPKPTQAST